MSNYANPNAVIDFLYDDGNFGPIHDSEKECVRHQNQDWYLALSGGVWSMSTTESGNNKINAATFGQLAHPATTVLGTEWGEEYEFVIQAPGGFKQLVSSGGYATIIDP